VISGGIAARGRGEQHGAQSGVSAGKNLGHEDSQLPQVQLGLQLITHNTPRYPDKYNKPHLKDATGATGRGMTRQLRAGAIRPFWASTLVIIRWG